MDFIFSGAFLALLLAFSAIALFLTQKLIDLFKAKSKSAKYTLSFFASAVLVFGTKILGMQTIASMLLLIGYSGNPPPMQAPSGGWATYILLFIFTFLVSGGIFDWRKLVKRE